MSYLVRLDILALSPSRLRSATVLSSAHTSQIMQFISWLSWDQSPFLISSHRMQSVQNLGLAVVPIVAGIVVDSGGYMLTEVMFCALLCLALLCGIALYIYDATHGGKLNKSAWARAREAKKDGEVSRSR